MRGNVGRSSSVVISRALVLVVAAPLACTSASGEVRGGEARFDAASPDEPTFADASPTSWKGIYRDFFGRRAKSSCAGNGACHDAAGKAGSSSSNFVCADVDGCYQSLRTGKKAATTNVPLPLALVEEVDILAPENARLFSVVRYKEPDGRIVENKGMPALPRDFAYAAADIDRMKAWIKAGAKND